MRTLLKRIVIELYCRRLLSMRATEAIFRRLRLSRH